MAKKGYTNEAQVQEILGTSSSVSDLNIEIAENIIDNYTSRNFIADTEATARYFDGNFSDRIMIDECVDITQIDINGDRILATGFTTITKYYEYPDNYESRNLPIDLVVLYETYFTKGRQNQKITAKWGYSVTCPADVSFAAAAICAGILTYGSGGNVKGVKSEKIGNYSVSYATEEGWLAFNRAKEILGVYKKIDL